MRWVAAVMLAGLAAGLGVGEAQVVWIGAGIGTSWEYKAAGASQTWTHRSDPTPQVFVALPLDNVTLVRLRVTEIPYDPPLLTGSASCTMLGYTMGVDYLMGGEVGETVFSAGLGGYRVVRDSGVVAKDVQATKFGYYLGVGQWFTLSPRWRLIGEVNMHRTENYGTPTLVTAAVGLAFSW